MIAALGSIRTSFLLALALLLTLLSACAGEDSQNVRHRISALDLPGYSRYLAVSPSVAYVGEPQGDSFSLIDISNPSAPRIVYREILPPPASIGAASAIAGDLLVASEFRTLKLFDIADPSNPRLLASIPIPSGLASGVVISGNRLYSAEDGGGFRIFDISNPTAPLLLGGIAGNINLRFTNFRIVGNLLYVAGSSQFMVVNVANPANPVIIGSTAMPTNRTAYDVAVSGNRAFIASFSNGVYVADISVPTAPVIGGNVPPADLRFGTTLSVDTFNGLGIASDAASGILVIDGSDAGIPMTQETVASPGETLQVKLIGTRAYVASGFGGFQIFDLSSL